MCVCMCVCVCVYVCMYVRMYVCIMYVCMCVLYMFVCIYVRMYVCMYVIHNITSFRTSERTCFLSVVRTDRSMLFGEIMFVLRISRNIQIHCVGTMPNFLNITEGGTCS